MSNPNAPRNLNEPTRFENVTQAEAWDNLAKNPESNYVDNNPDDSTDIGPESDGDLYNEQKAQTIETKEYGDSTPEVIASETSETIESASPTPTPEAPNTPETPEITESESIEEIELPPHNDELEAMEQADQSQAQEIDDYYANHPEELAQDLSDIPEANSEANS